MACRSFLLSLLFLLPLVQGQAPSNDSQSSQCRCMPGDDCWPSSAEWNTFNDTLGGKLIATVPYPAPCHNADYGPYNETACADLQSTFFYADPHIDWPSSFMAVYFTNGSCDPWAPQDQPCTIGNYVSYSVNATGPEDYQKVINFTTQNNIRLVVKNTGHDYNGKSTGAGAVAIWTHNMKSIELVSNYTSANYTGKALKIGAGIQVREIYQFAHDNGLVAVGGNDPTPGVAGGYTQGAGHGPLASKFGLGADQALEWEVVTGTGELLVASATNNSDLFWALCGGGGGTYGVVSSLTVKAYPDLVTSAANLTFAAVGHEDQFWETVQLFQENLLPLVDAGATAFWVVADGVFSLSPATAPGMFADQLQALMQPTLDKLNQTGISYNYSIQQFDTFLDSYNGFDAAWNNSQSLIGGRLIPRSLVEQNASALNNAIRNMSTQAASSGIVVSGMTVNVSRGVPSPDSVAVNPYWRTAIYDMVIGVNFNYTDWTRNVGAQNQITHDLLPQVEALTPDGGAYLNECDFQQPDWQDVFYGPHYERLKQIKSKYDPNDIFYAVTGVGSEAWFEDQSDGGRLCRVS